MLTWQPNYQMNAAFELKDGPSTLKTESYVTSKSCGRNLKKKQKYKQKRNTRTADMLEWEPWKTG